jgi:type IV pilus assembly protein PilZ
MSRKSRPSIPEAETGAESKRVAEDHRRDERAQITLRVDYKRLNTFFADYTRNISKGGTFIRTNKPLALGTQFVFVLSVPAREDAQLRLLGEVKWIVAEDAATAEQPAGMGIRFVFADDSDRTRVEAFVEKLMHDALGPHLSGKLLDKKK